NVTQILKNHVFQISTADGALSRLKSIDPVTKKISWIEQKKNTEAPLRDALVGSSTAFTADDEVVEVLTYNAAFDQTQILKNHIFQVSTADSALSRLKSI